MSRGPRFIDVDVHERAALEDLLPYLDPVWHKYITDAAAFLKGIDSITDLPQDAVDDSVAKKVLGDQQDPGQIEALR